MYTIILLIILVIGGMLIVRGIRRQRRNLILYGALVATVALLLPQLFVLWGELLWFQAVGYGQRFWVVAGSRLLLIVGVALLSFGLMALLLWHVPRSRQVPRWGGMIAAAVLGGTWGISNWELFLKFFHAVPTGLSEPVLGHDASFYLFALPFLEQAYTWIVGLIAVALVASIIAVFVQMAGERQIIFRQPAIYDLDSNIAIRAMYMNAGLLFIALGVGKWLDRYYLMYSSWGAVHGPGWTDVNVRLPAYLVVAVLTAAVGVVLLIPSWRRRLLILPERFGTRPDRPHLVVLGIAALVTVATWFVALALLPGLLQRLRVEPNEITFERPYIQNNIEFTRYGFRLHDVEERQFDPGEGTFTAQTVAENPELLRNVRLWDWRALDDVYRQFQEIRLYYEFVGVDVDRYTLDGEYHQVMVSAREMEIDNLPQKSQTFVNKRFKYTHGYGITLTNVSEFTPEGLPKLLVKDIPPQSSVASLSIERPEIYYGELTNSYVIVNSREAEFDYPSRSEEGGSENVYTRYEGRGGVQLSSLWRKFLYSYLFDGTRLLLSNYPTSESRIMFHRQIRERVQMLAPFLYLDQDPYIVAENGRLYWILDAYTHSSYFPYSEPFRGNSEFVGQEVSPIMTPYLRQSLLGQNYLRNSVKVVVDAYDGTVDFYKFEEEPIVQTWERIFPGMFKTRDEMPDYLERHVRYPEDMLLIQGLVYSKYHMDDPTVFYNQEDLWIRATEKYYSRVQPVEPYYIMWQFEEGEQPEFVLIQPFTPKNKQVLIGWIAGMSDGDNYGRFLAYKFPKDNRILGPQQVETKIDQDRYLSAQLSLWDQRGSQVIRGNVLAIPIGNTLIYVEPIYLQAETAAYPELRLVAVMHNDQLSYGPTFEEALAGLTGRANERLARAEGLPTIDPDNPGVAPQRNEDASLAQQANDAFETYLEATGRGDYSRAADALETLENRLRDLLAEEGAQPTVLPSDTGDTAARPDTVATAGRPLTANRQPQ